MNTAVERHDFHYEIANNGATAMLTPMRENAKEWCRSNLEEQRDPSGRRVIRKATTQFGRSYLFPIKRGSSLLGHLQHKALLNNEPTKFSVLDFSQPSSRAK